MTSTAPLDTRPTGSAERRRPIDWLVALLWIGAIVAATVQRSSASHSNNFRIFRAASRHLFAGLDLYAAYPVEHFDFYKYSPTFALLFAPFAYVPFAAATFLWHALNAGALWVALGLVLPRKAATVARAIVFLDMLGSLQSAQSNSLVAALIIFTFAAYERHHTALGSLAAITGTYIKLFPLAGLSFAIFHPRKLRVALAVVVGMILFAALPLLVTTPERLLAQYTSWRAIQSVNTLNRGYSVMRMIDQVTHADFPNWPIQLVGVLILVAPVVIQTWRWHDWDLRRLYLCSVLVFCLIFNHLAESPMFVIAIAGAAIWFATIARPSRWEWALLGFIVVFTIISSSDLMPHSIQRDFFDRYRFKTVPLIVLWIELQRRLWWPRVREARPS
ncbi:MAG TPA: glycosyltransferase family 87 protein [Gemmatimonadaceae bacterium]|nr:glycosyltransferase family 87 protein [Gemmatimonadaceae bacterium]